MADAKSGRGSAPPGRPRGLSWPRAASRLSDFRVGAEHEKFGFRQGDAAAHPLLWRPDGIEALLKGLMRFGWQGEYEASGTAWPRPLIGLTREGANVSLEPGGQFELSGAPLETMHDICCGDLAAT